jgi:hypothetical protein
MFVEDLRHRYGSDSVHIRRNDWEAAESVTRVFEGEMARQINRAATRQSASFGSNQNISEVQQKLIIDLGHWILRAALVSEIPDRRSLINILVRNLIDLLETAETRILKNPTKSQLKDFLHLVPSNIAKGLVAQNGDIFVWSAFHNHHQSVSRELGIEHGLEFTIAEDGATIDRECFSPGFTQTVDGAFALQTSDEPEDYNASRNFVKGIGELPTEMLAEAPLADISVHGTPLDQQGSFDQMNRRLIDKAIFHGIYHEKLRKLPFDLYVYVLNQEGLHEFSERMYNTHANTGGGFVGGKVVWSNPPEVRGDYNASFKIPELGLVRDAVSKNSNGTNVNLILGNNFAAGGRDVPMTPWMMVHRLLHCIEYIQFENFRAFPEQASTKNEIVGYKSKRKISWWDIAMMKSVRNDDPDFDNDAELVMEMAVEYFYTGNIRVNRQKVTEKCEVFGLNVQNILKRIDLLLSAYKVKLDMLANQMKGQTFYI